MLLEAETRNPGPWVAHSRNVALAAKCIAEHCPELDAAASYILGLLHDIGRREGVTGMRHTLDGYAFLHERGFEDAARICLTHSFPRQDAQAIFGRWDVTTAEFEVVEAYLSKLEYDDYDRLLQLCDCLALPEGICLLEKRMVDAALRYGVNAYTVSKWQGYIELQAYFEGIIGGSIYGVLPGVMETTFGLEASSKC